MVFVKHDLGKLRYDLVPAKALKALVQVLTYGANKYSDINWLKCDDPMRYYGACMRHLEAWRSGEELDPESGLPHLAHAASSLFFLLALPKVDSEESVPTIKSCNRPPSYRRSNGQ